MKLTFLGTGTSQGVPVIGCKCAVCNSSDPRDNRLRASVLVEVEGQSIVIDTGPDFRFQMLREDINHLDTILLTHEHKDHIGGLDDVRAFNFIDYPIIHKIDIYATKRTLRCVRKDFDYAFGEDRYRGAPEINLVEIKPTEPFYIDNILVTPIKGMHSSRFSVTGYRIGNLAYLTDFKTIEDSEVAKLVGVEVLIVNALRFEEHYSHFNVAEAVELIERVSPKKAYLTHMSHDIGLYADVIEKLPATIYMAYDRLQITINDR